MPTVASDKSYKQTQTGKKSFYQVELVEGGLQLRPDHIEKVSRDYQWDHGNISMKETYADRSSKTYQGRFTGTSLLGNLDGHAIDEEDDITPRVFLIGNPGKTRAFVHIDEHNIHVDWSYREGWIDTIDIGLDLSADLDDTCLTSFNFGRFKGEKGPLYYSCAEAESETGKAYSTTSEDCSSSRYSTTCEQELPYINNILGHYQGTARIYVLCPVFGAYRTIFPSINRVGFTSDMDYDFAGDLADQSSSDLDNVDADDSHDESTPLLRTSYRLHAFRFKLMQFDSTSYVWGQSEAFYIDKLGQVVNIKKEDDLFISEKYIPGFNLEGNFHMDEEGNLVNVEFFITRQDSITEETVMETVYLGSSQLSFFGLSLNQRKLGVLGLNRLKRDSESANFPHRFWQSEVADGAHKRAYDRVEKALAEYDLEPDSSIPRGV